MEKTYVEVRTQFESLHCWPEAPEVVAFLREPHRHLFKVRVRVETTADRQIEFISMLKRVKEWLKSFEGSIGETSCETVAGYLVQAVRSKVGDDREIEAEVSEDGENGGMVKWVP